MNPSFLHRLLHRLPAAFLPPLSLLTWDHLLQLLQRRPHSSGAAQSGGSVFVYYLNCGSNNALDGEIQALFGPVYDAGHFGFQRVAAPRHADLLLLGGPLTRSLRSAVLAALEAMPEPRRVITLGDDFNPQAPLYAGSYALPPLPGALKRDWIAHIPGDPPTPAAILQALLDLDW